MQGIRGRKAQKRKPSAASGGAEGFNVPAWAETARTAIRTAEVSIVDRKPSLIGIVRMSYDEICERIAVGATHEAIAASLTEAGLPITAKSLERYHRQVRRERAALAQIATD